MRQYCEYFTMEKCKEFFFRGCEHLKRMSKTDPDSVFVEHIKDKQNGGFGEDINCNFRLNGKETHKSFWKDRSLRV